MFPKQAARTILSLIREQSKLVNPKRDDNGLTVAHAIWLLEGIEIGYIEGDKAHRWLGYAQAILVTEKVADLSSMKHINMTSKEFPYLEQEDV